MKQKIWTEEQRAPGLGPVELLERLMKQRKLRGVDLAAELGISESLLSDIRGYRRGLSKEVIRKLAARFEVEQEGFNRPYNLVSQRKIEKPPDRAGKPQQNPTPKKGPKDKPILELLQLRTGMPTIVRMKDGSLVSKPAIEGEDIDICYTSDIVELIDPATGNNLYCG